MRSRSVRALSEFEHSGVLRHMLASADRKASTPSSSTTTFPSRRSPTGRCRCCCAGRRDARPSRGLGVPKQSVSDGGDHPLIHASRATLLKRPWRCGSRPATHRRRLSSATAALERRPRRVRFCSLHRDRADIGIAVCADIASAPAPTPTPTPLPALQPSLAQSRHRRPRHRKRRHHRRRRRTRPRH